jgi:LmbE family N-acetylglucosaminyl deacetylase
MSRKILERLRWILHACCMGTAFLLSACATPPLSIPHEANATSFYIVAHPDDIELFMGRNAWRDIQAHAPRVVFIVLTAGDAGLGMDYAMARESGHERALRFWVGLDGKEPPATRTTTVPFNGLVIERHSIGNLVAVYNLRLPDGNFEGVGYPVTGNEALRILRAGSATATIHSIDGRLSLRYRQLEDLLASILQSEARGSSDVWVNIQDEDPKQNPGDHADHTATAQIVLDVLRQPGFACVSVARYLDYVMTGMPQNMDTQDTLLHAGTWGALNSGRVDGLQASTWDSVHNAWLGKEHVRATSSGQACAL